MTVYFGQWEWYDAIKEQPHWRAPLGTASGVLDLRSIPEMGTPKTMSGFLIAAYDGPRKHDLLLLDLGNDLDAPLKNKPQLQSLWKRSIGADTLRDIIHELLLLHGDPTGENAHKPAYGSQGIEILLAGQRIAAHNDAQAQANTIAIFQNDYRILRSELQPDMLEKVVGHKMFSMFGRMTDEHAGYLIPKEFSRDRWRKPSTTLTDNFNRANAGSLGTASGGGTWSEVINSGHEILSNRARSTGALTQDKESRLDSDLSSADHYAQADVVTLPQPALVAISAGTCVRFASAASTFYKARVLYFDHTGGFGPIDGQIVNITKWITGTESTISSDHNVTLSLPQPIKTQASGSSISGYFNNVLQETVTDTSITTGLRVGIGGFDRGDDYELDNLTAADVAAATATFRRTLNTRAGSRG